MSTCFARACQQLLLRLRMIADTLPPQEVDAFFTGGASRAVEEKIQPPQQADRAEILEKAEKMLRVGMDERVVRRKMEAAGFQNHEIDQFIGI